jgi:hypothetical protein
VLASPAGVLTRRRLSWWAVIGLLVVVGVSFAVGHLAARAHTGYVDWELASIFGTALGTTMLAIATGALAYTTTEDQEARERPVVLLVDAQWSSYPETETESQLAGVLVVTLRNVGLGPALRIDVQAHYVDPAFQPTITRDIVPVLMVGEVVRLSMRATFAAVPPGGVRPDGFPVSGTYLDRSQHRTHSLISSWASSAPLAIDRYFPAA